MTNKLYEIKHRATDKILFARECGSLRICVEAAVADHCDLSHADLSIQNLRYVNLSNCDLSFADFRFANLHNANLSFSDVSFADFSFAWLRGTDMSDTAIIDGGQDARGFRFIGWRRKDGAVIYRADYDEWDNYVDACDHYTDGYSGTGDINECLARLRIIHLGAIKREWIS